MDGAREATGGAWGRPGVKAQSPPVAGPQTHAGHASSGAHHSGPTAETYKQTMHNRLLFAVVNMIGLSVSVHVKNGAIYEGVLHTCRPEIMFSLVLRHAKQTTPPTGEKPVKDGEQPRYDVLVIYQEDFVMLTAHHVDLGFAETSTDTFRTDAEISGGEIREKELQRWEPTGEDILPGLDDDHSLHGHFDQFAGKDSTFDEALYTTVLDETEFDRDVHERAARIADQIMKGDASNVHVAEERGLAAQKDYDEEELYGAVIRTGAPKPAATTTTTTTTTAAAAGPKASTSSPTPSVSSGSAAPPTPTNTPVVPAAGPPKMSFAQAMRAGTQKATPAPAATSTAAAKPKAPSPVSLPVKSGSSPRPTTPSSNQVPLPGKTGPSPKPTPPAASPAPVEPTATQTPTATPTPSESAPSVPIAAAVAEQKTATPTPSTGPPAPATEQKPAPTPTAAAAVSPAPTPEQKPAITPAPAEKPAQTEGAKPAATPSPTPAAESASRAKTDDTPKTPAASPAPAGTVTGDEGAKPAATETPSSVPSSTPASEAPTPAPAPVKSKLNPNAKEFTMNVNAKPFVPSGAFAAAPRPAPPPAEAYGGEYVKPRGKERMDHGPGPEWAGNMPYGRPPKSLMEPEGMSSPTFTAPAYPQGMVPGQPMPYPGGMFPPGQYPQGPVYMPPQKLYTPVYVPAAAGRVYPVPGMPPYDGPGMPIIAMPPGAMYGQPGAPPYPGAYMMPGMEMEPPGEMMGHPPPPPPMGRRGTGGGSGDGMHGQRVSPKPHQHPHQPPHQHGPGPKHHGPGGPGQHPMAHMQQQQMPQQQQQRRRDGPTPQPQSPQPQP